MLLRFCRQPKLMLLFNAQESAKRLCSDGTTFFKEGISKKVLQFLTPLEPIYNKNFCQNC